MKKFLIAAAASFLIFSGQPDVEASNLPDIGTQDVQVEEMGKWAHFRDKYILGRETENERRDRKEWERRHGRHYSRDRHDRYRDYYPPPPPPRHRDRYRDYPPPPPPPPRHRY